jgi:thioredoxin reductase (NADPH)
MLHVSGSDLSGTSSSSNQSAAPAGAFEPSRPVDCAIVGGGPAGLSAAICLARMRRSVLVIDDRDGRSLWGQTNRNYLGFPNGIPAAEIRLAGRRQAARYGAKFLRGRVVVASRDDGAFQLRVEASGGDRIRETAGRVANVKRDEELGSSLGEETAVGPVDVVARTVILATGVRDNFPRFLGWAQCVGKSLFWCIACDGYESTGKAVAVVGHDEDAAETALDLLDFTANVTIVAGRLEGFDLPERRLADLRDNGIGAYPHAVAAYANADGQIEELVLDDPDETRLPVEMVFAYRRPTPRNDVAIALGVETNELGHIVVNAEQHTNVPGLYAAGDVTSPHDHQVSAAVHEGNQAACAVNYFLYRPVQKAPDKEEC